MEIKFYSQFGEDKWMYENLAMPIKGVFIDVGAGHPVDLSNTYWLESQFGWSGVCIDADSHWYKELCAKRKNVELALISNDYADKNFEQSHPYGHEFSNISNNESGTKIKSIRLQDVLDKYEIGKIDLLSIDVEGHELEVLNSFNWEKHKPTIVIAEFNVCNVSFLENEIMDFFFKMPQYRLVKRTSTNLIFTV